MNPSLSLRALVRSVAPHVAVAALTLLLTAWVLKLWRADLHVPLGYVGDCMVVQVWAKGILENGWYLHNDAVGAPAALDMHDYPMADNLHFLFLKGIALVTRHYGLTTNYYLLLTFPLTAVTSLFVLRHFRVGLLPAAAMSILYALLPFHFFRGRHHLFLASYYLVPLMIMVIIWVFQDRLFFFRLEKAKERTRLAGGPWGLALAAVVIFLLTASAGVYYAFFACFFLLVAGVSAALMRRRLYPLASSVILAGILTGGVLLNLVPTFVHAYQTQSNPAVVDRDYGFVEQGALKIIQMLLPITEHRLTFLGDLKAAYNGVLARTGLVNENDHASLGVLGSVGFLFLMGWFLFRRWTSAPAGLFDVLSLLTITGLLLATTGGFGAVLGWFVSPLIRSYNRMSVFLAYFAFFAVALLLDAAGRRYVHSRISGVFYAGFLALLLGAGVLDQTSRLFACSAPFHQALEEQFHSDAAFVAEVEASVPADTVIFQLPYMQFPEARQPHRLLAYDHLRAYLHSNRLRWSFGVMKGTDGDAWQRVVAEKPLPEQVETLVCAGFGGLYLDRAGYHDAGAGIEADLRRLLRTEPLVSRDQRLCFFNLAPYAEELRYRWSPDEWDAKCAAARTPLLVHWQRGFYGLEGARLDDFVMYPLPAGDTWRWCAKTGEMLLDNPSDRHREVELKMGFETCHGLPARLQIESELVSVQAQIGHDPTPHVLRLSVPPGRHVLRFECRGKRPHNLPDARKLQFRVINFSCKEVFYKMTLK